MAKKNNKIDIVIGSITDVGKVRDGNEDSLGFVETDKWRVVIVCDGMGGHAGGEVASAMTVESIKNVISNVTEEKPHVFLETALKNANTNVYNYALQNPQLQGMGTTCVLIAVDNYGKTYIAHIGDSRCYLNQNASNAFFRVTKDHSKVQEMVDAGWITPEEAEVSEQKNIITRAIGLNPDCKVDIQGPLAPKKNDVFMLCSDGLSDMVTDSIIKQIMEDKTPQQACLNLVEAANNAGGFDNITVCVVKFNESVKRTNATIPINPPKKKRKEKKDRKFNAKEIFKAVAQGGAVALIIVTIAGVGYYLKEIYPKNSLRNQNINIAKGLITSNKFNDAKNTIQEYIATSDDATNLHKKIVKKEKEYNVRQKAEKLNPNSLTQITDFVDNNRQKVSIEIIKKYKKELYEKLNKNAIRKIETTGLDSTGFIAILKNMYSPKQPPEIVLNKLIENAKKSDLLGTQKIKLNDLIKKKKLLSKITKTFPSTKSKINSGIVRLEGKITRQIEPKMKAALVKIDKYIEAGKLNEAAIEIKNIEDYSSYSTTNFSQTKSKFNLIKNWKDVIKKAPVAIKYKNISFVGYTNDQILLPILGWLIF